MSQNSRLPDYPIARLRAKVRVAEYLDNPTIRGQAIAEAKARGIDLNLIGVEVFDE